ncbi:MAG: hypothetical protein KGM42_19810, partial [Hyphomicrobiales bacterium]|nr:hypothetical protein [Hyphomicrobiales bacterium]
FGRNRAVSFPRKRESSSHVLPRSGNWMPAFAGMTVHRRRDDLQSFGVDGRDKPGHDGESRGSNRSFVGIGLCAERTSCRAEPAPTQRFSLPLLLPASVPQFPLDSNEDRNGRT